MKSFPNTRRKELEESRSSGSNGDSTNFHKWPARTSGISGWITRAANGTVGMEGWVALVKNQWLQQQKLERWRSRKESLKPKEQESPPTPRLTINVTLSFNHFWSCTRKQHKPPWTRSRAVWWKSGLPGTVVKRGQNGHLNITPFPRMDHTVSEPCLILYPRNKVSPCVCCRFTNLNVYLL